MPRYMGFHTLPKNAITFDQVCEMAKNGQQDTSVTGYRSFLNTREGKAVCILDAENKQAVEAFFRKMNLPTDLVVEVEIEGDHGTMHDLSRETAMA